MSPTLDHQMFGHQNITHQLHLLIWWHTYWSVVPTYSFDVSKFCEVSSNKNLFFCPQILVDIFPFSFSILYDVRSNLLLSSWSSFCSFFFSWFQTKTACLWYHHFSDFQVHTIWFWFLPVAVFLTTGPKPLQKRALHIGRSRASSFRLQYPVLSLSSPSSSTRFLPTLPVTSIPPFIFP
jgi:hypothetical protein